MNINVLQEGLDREWERFDCDQFEERAVNVLLNHNVIDQRELDLLVELVDVDAKLLGKVLFARTGLQDFPAYLTKAFFNEVCGNDTYNEIVVELEKDKIDYCEQMQKDYVMDLEKYNLDFINAEVVKKEIQDYL